jgi:peptidoglycan/LPS O-acetylase OafA/YrhL
MPNSKWFRPEIQSLRGLAVLLVFLSHTGSTLFPNGFIGVDVFFVISGYVITQLLSRHVEQHGRVLFLSFYSRRLLRLAPAFLVVLLVTCVLFFYMSSPAEYVRQLDEALYSNFWLANYFFSSQDVAYFDELPNAYVFLHTWSLSVEEQFYLVWPLCFTAIIVFSDRYSKNSTLKWLLLLTLFLFIYSLILSVLSPKVSFFSPAARAWQFSLGASIAIYHSRLECSRIEYGFLALVARFLGFLLILYSASSLFYFDELKSIYSVFPSLGAALLLIPSDDIRFGKVGRIVVWPMLLMGTLSYSFYLWHWPVLVFFGRFANVFSDVSSQWLAFGISVMLAAMTYSMVERPMRKAVYLVVRPRMVLFGGLSMIVFMGIVLSVVSPMYMSSSKVSIKEMNSVRRDRPEFYKYGCDSWYSSSELMPCGSPKSDDDKVLVLLGDSVVAQWYPALKNKYTRNGWRMIVLTKSACPMVDASIYYKRIGAYYTICDDWREQALAYVESIKPEVVITGGSWNYSFSRDDWERGLQSVVKRLSSSVGEVRIISPTPSLSVDGPDCVQRVENIEKYLGLDISEFSCASAYSEPSTNHYYRAVSNNFLNVEYIDVQDLVCPEVSCKAKANDIFTFRDSSHLTTRFVESKSEEFQRLLNVKY